MKKQLIGLMFTALTFGMMMSINTMAETGTDGSVGISKSGSVYLNSSDAKQDEVKAFQLSLEVEPRKEGDNIEEVAFDFNLGDNVKVSEYRYHAETNTMNIYVADSEPVFNSTGSMNIGEVTAKDENGNKVNVDVTVKEDSVQFFSQGNLTQMSFTSEDIVEHGGDVEVRKTFPASYQIKIPVATYEIETDKDFTVSAGDVLIGYGETLEVAVSSKNNWNLRDRNRGNTESVKYHLICDGKEVKDGKYTVLSVEGGEESGKATLTLGLIDEMEVAGTFTDVLTFEVSVD